MRRVVLGQPRPDCLTVRVGRDWARASVGLVALSAVCGLMLLPERGTFASMLALAVGAATTVTVAAFLRRALAVHRHTLCRAGGRLLLDTEPLELARVELKLKVTPIVQRPRRYVLTLWVMSAVGPDELPLGSFRTLLEASSVSGLLEDFVQRADVKLHRLA